MRAAPPPAALATPWGWRWTKERVVEDADPYGGWKTGRVPRDILRGYPTPGRGSAERSDAGGDRSSGTSRTPSPTGRLRQREVSDNTASGRGGTPPLQGAGETWWGRRGPLRRDVEDAVPYGALPVSRLYERKMPPQGGIFSLCVFVYITIAFLGQMSWQVPQAMHLSSSRVQVLAARSTARAPAGHFLAQSVQ